MSTNLVVDLSIHVRMSELGEISPNRVRFTPQLVKATIDDLIAINESEENGLFELVDGCLVEKAMSYEASVVAAAILSILRVFISKHRLGLVSGPDGFFQLQSSTRGPNVAFVALDRLPGGAFPTQAYPGIAPNLVVEVLSPGNTKGEMAKKRLEYFQSGVKIVWIVDCKQRTITIYTSPSIAKVVSETETIDGGESIPGFSSLVADFFSDLDIGAKP